MQMRRVPPCSRPLEGRCLAALFLRGSVPLTELGSVDTPPPRPLPIEWGMGQMDLCWSLRDAVDGAEFDTEGASE